MMVTASKIPVPDPIAPANNKSYNLMWTEMLDMSYNERGIENVTRF